MQSKNIDKVSSVRGNKTRKNIWFALLLGTFLFLINTSFAQSVRAQGGQVLSGGGGGAIGIPGTLGNDTMNGSETSAETSSDQINLWHKDQYNSEPRVPVGGGDQSGGSSGGSRELQAGSQPPQTKPVSTMVPPVPMTFQQPQEMITTTNGAGNSPSVTGDGPTYYRDAI